MPRDYRDYLADIDKSIKKIQKYTSDCNQSQFINNDLVYDTVVFNLQIIGEANAVSGDRNINTGGGEYRETNLQDDSRYVETRDSSTYYENYNSPEKQTLAEAAAEIQKLLQQLKQSNPDATVEQQQAYVDAAISPSIKERCASALKAGGETAIEEFLDNLYVNVGKAVVKAWIKP